MDRWLADFTLAEDVSAQHQIAAHVRQLVLSGRLAPGTKLPATQELAARWGAPVATVHAALTPLVKEGLLRRRQRAGTTVRARRARLQRVGVYVPGYKSLAMHTGFAQALLAALEQELASRGMESIFWIDPRTVVAQRQLWPELAAAAAEQRLDALIVPITDQPHLAWLRKLPVLTAFGSTAPLPNVVWQDLAQLAATGLQELAAQGARSVGLIAVVAPRAVRGGAAPHPHHRLFQQWERSVAELGLVCRPQWLKYPPLHKYIAENHAAQFGYDSLRALCQESPRPEGVLVFTDVAASGVIMALLEQQVPVPAEMKLVLHRNVEVGLLCPFPATFLDASARDYAAALVDQIEAQAAGLAVAPRVLPFSLTHHQPPTLSPRSTRRCVPVASVAATGLSR